MWYTIFDGQHPEHYIWARNIGIERLYELLSEAHAFYGHISVNFIPGIPEEMSSRGAAIQTEELEWKTTFYYYTIREFIKAYKMDLRKIDLFYVDPADQTDEICLAAVKRDPSELYYVVNQTDEICKEALRKDGHVLTYVRNKTEELVRIAINSEPYWALHHTPRSLQTREICFEAAKKDIYALGEIRSRDLRREIAALFRGETDEKKVDFINRVLESDRDWK